MLKVDFTDASVRIKAHWTSDGSVFAGTITAECHMLETHVEIESDDDPARVAALVRNAKGGCYAEATVREPVELHSTVKLNGEEFDYDQYPRRIERRR